jgi:hypothetical protein
MIDPIAYWTPLIGGLTGFVTLLLKIIELFGEMEKVRKLMKKLPHLLKLLGKFLIYALSLVIPNVAIIWYFFYLAGISPERLWQVNFFWAVVAQPTVGVSIYAYVWAKWIYPRLKHTLGGSRPQQEPKLPPRPPNESSKSGGRK